MSNERPNEFLPWRGQLTGTDALPEQGLDDKEQSWQRLAERLQKQPRRGGIAWWIAAACLILAFFFPAAHLFRGRPTYPPRVSQHSPARLRPVTKLRRVLVTSSDLASAPRPATIANPRASRFTPHQPVPFGQPHLASRFNLGEIAPITSPPSSTVPNAHLADAPLLATIAPPISQPPTAPPRHALRIVYLNEISKDPGRSPGLASGQPAFIRLSTASSSDWTVNPNSSSVIKIGISLPNH